MTGSGSCPARCGTSTLTWPPSISPGGSPRPPCCGPGPVRGVPRPVTLARSRASQGRRGQGPTTRRSRYYGGGGGGAGGAPWPARRPGRCTARPRGYRPASGAGTGVWLCPTGWADIGYSPSEVALKEVEEETGIEVEPVSLIAVFDGMRLGFHSIPLYSLIFHCRMTGGSLKPHPLECLDVGFFARDQLPEPLAGSGLWVEMAFAAIDGRQTTTFFDRPRDPTWRSHPGDDA